MSMGLKCVCFAEVNRSNWNGVLGKEGWAKAKGYTDWRKMFEKHAKELDVVFVATPDHSHFAPTMTAISHGIHCYTEKPLTWSVREAQLLAEAYAKNPKVVTQMGNQGHAGQGWRIAYEFIKGGAIGDVLEFHTWTNRPIWPQGGDRPTWSDPVPANRSTGKRGSARRRCGLMPSDHEQGEARRAAAASIIRSSGADSVDFGSGALGDMACHTTDGIYAIMAARLRRHGRADLHDRAGQGPIPRRHDHQDDLPCQGRSPRLHHLLVRGKGPTAAPTCRRRPRN